MLTGKYAVFFLSPREEKKRLLSVPKCFWSEVSTRIAKSFFFPIFLCFFFTSHYASVKLPRSQKKRKKKYLLYTIIWNFCFYMASFEQLSENVTTKLFVNKKFFLNKTLLEPKFHIIRKKKVLHRIRICKPTFSQSTTSHWPALKKNKNATQIN